ncbi:MAG TPA: outer membrane beta-barrel protein [Chitinophagaceae bacterium]|nr:outer membrane beta-barrel protein [Chitinophagaceae bacterium]HUM64934.1 outer membrane beta-barrel protein [Chitinophagaceae bacterium]
MKKSITLILVIVSFCIASEGQVRQRSAIKGFNAAARIHTLGWASEYFQYLDENASSGFGGGLRLGYGITELLEPYVGFDFTSIGKSDIDAKSFGMTHIDVGLRVNLAGTINPVRPFVQAGYSFLKGKVDEVANGASYVDLEFYGGKPHVGGGLNYFFKIPISVFAEGIFTVGKKSKAKLDGTEIPDEPDVTTFRINVGVSFNLSELTKK